MKRTAILCLAIFSTGLVASDLFGQVDGSRAPGAGRTGSRSVKLNAVPSSSRATRVSSGSRHGDGVNLSSLSRDVARIKAYEGKMQRHHDDLQKFASENGIKLDVIRDNKLNDETVKRLQQSQEALKNSGNSAKSSIIESLLSKINEMRGEKQEKLENAQERWQTKKENAQEKKGNAQEHWQAKKENAQEHFQNKRANVQDRAQQSNNGQSNNGQSGQQGQSKKHAQSKRQNSLKKGSAGAGQSRSTRLNAAGPSSRSGNTTRIEASDRGGSSPSKKTQSRPASTRSR
ncbi:MAG: hypothetical protein ACI9HK_001401 [Pirellulaceae bacterium]|jgi:hypothetical protein